MSEARPVGVILAGGAGRRIGGEKAIVELRGRPLISYPLETMRVAMAHGDLSEVAVIAKPESALPSLPGVTVWLERARLAHPLCGVVEALELAGGRPVVVCAVDLPFVSVGVLGALASADPGPGGAVVVRSSGGEVQPLLGCYRRAVAGLLWEAATRGAPAREAVLALAPRVVDVDDPRCLFNVNAPEDLLRASAMLDRGPA